MAEMISPFYGEKPYHLDFTLEPNSTVLAVTDVQYASGSRDAWIGKERSEQRK